MVTAVAAQYGAQLRGYLRYGIQWESPVSSQVAVGDIGRTALDCTTLGQPISINSANPWYDPAGYASTALAVDYSRLRYNAANSRRPVFWDGNNDGNYTTITYPSNPNCVTPDLNLDGVLSANEDRPLTSYAFGPGKVVFSRQATQALLSNGVFTLATWPSAIATPTEAESFWNLREAVSQYADATANISDYEGMSLAGYEDHIQYAPEKPHVHQAFDGWNGRGRWVKVNPSRSYVWEEEPTTATRTDLPENSPNVAPNWTNRSSYAYPDDLENVYYSAAVHEMADRARNRPVNNDTQAPAVRVISPNGGLLYKRGRSVTISWEVSDNVGVVSQEVQLSTDGGQTYTNLVANLDGTATSYVWNVSVALSSSKSCLIRIRASDAAGNVGSDTTDGYIAVW
jgi:hypothetical protein